MALNIVTLTFSEQDAGAVAVAGDVTITPTSRVVAAGQTVVSDEPVTVPLVSGAASIDLVACDNDSTVPAPGFWAYEIALPGEDPGLYLVNHAGGAAQRFDQLGPAATETTYGPAEAAALPKTGGTMTGWLAPAVVALTFGTTISVNAALGNDFRLTLTASTGTIANPANPVDGQVIDFAIAQDATGSRTVAWGTAYDFGTAGAPALSTAASKVDLAGFRYHAGLAKWICFGSALGF